MGERMIQVPVSRLYEIATTVGEESRILMVDALLSRPNPSAEACPVAVEHAPHEWDVNEGEVGSGSRCPGVTAPPRIEDMAPGTTFTGALDRAFSDNSPFRFMVVSRIGVQQVVDSDGDIWFPGDLDPSTIRDVTPPAPTT